MENQDQELFALGLISQNLENLGIETAIEKNSNPNEQDNAATSLQFLLMVWHPKKNMIYILNLEKKEMKNY